MLCCVVPARRACAVLGISAVLEGYSLWVAFKCVRKAAKARKVNVSVCGWSPPSCRAGQQLQQMQMQQMRRVVLFLCIINFVHHE